MIKVFIADDHNLIREGLKRVFAKEIDIEVVGECEETKKIITHLRRTETDVLILDINMPGKSGLDVLKEIKRKLPNLKIIILSMFPEDDFSVRALKLGASGYITKQGNSEEIVKAIRMVFTGNQYITQKTAAKLADDVSDNNNVSSLESLSRREMQIMLMLGKGKTITMISKELSLSISSVNTYRIRILEKLKMNSNVELIQFVIRNNLEY